ncbi:hypothetical protein BJ322DRAFT_1103555 [Thelephora terrestris]|uniref:Ribonuclease H1 N-terminal domain-containing protein n=1 Tax=Thelephora terrestris TaxID=56493 RepID=A0A9P6HQY7_9AGAM|nr:hypothetical protein BJ322DRAFT_1103555 [Thelephora terrestris]
MDKDIVDALSQLLLVSGGPEKAKEYFENISLTNISTPPSGSVDLRQPPAPELLSPLVLGSMNPWQDSPVGSFQISDVASPRRKAPSHANHSDTRHRAAAVYEPADGSSIDGGIEFSPWPTPSTTSARLRSNQTADALSSSPVHSKRSVRSPTPTISAVSQTEPRRSTRNHRSGVTASPSPLSSPLPAGGGMPRALGIHPDLSAIEVNESTLLKHEFELVKSKIRADPNYLGELPFIRLTNPQHVVRTLVHAPPERGSGRKWYYVSKGRAIGIFAAWSHVAEATQGVSKAVHQSYHSKEEAIVAYQVCLLKGKVELVNQKLPNNLIEEDEWECGYE